jgi:S-DNA-T family DNA segregation ATPase FtsK/SpoIIIE
VASGIRCKSVLGDGARDRGAACDQISSDPRIGAGVAFVRLEAVPDPVRVRAAFVSDDDIHAMTAAYTSGKPAGMPALAPGEDA